MKKAIRRFWQITFGLIVIGGVFLFLPAQEAARVSAWIETVKGWIWSR